MKVLVYNDETYTIMWDSVKYDIEGNEEDSVYYRVDIKRVSNNVTIWYRTTAQTQVSIRGSEFYTGTFYVQVVAYDANLNLSDPGLSNNCIIAPICWQFVKLAKPRMPEGFKIEVDRTPHTSSTIRRGSGLTDCRWSIMYEIPT